jgi:hemin uptake protein HemP
MQEAEPHKQDARLERRSDHEACSIASVIDSHSLFRGRQEVCIVHNGETYRLRVTRNGKLILNK